MHLANPLLLSVLLIAWQELGWTLTAGGLTFHHERREEHPTGAYPHGYKLAVHRNHELPPLELAMVRVYTDAPILNHTADTELPGRNEPAISLQGR